MNTFKDFYKEMYYKQVLAGMFPNIQDDVVWRIVDALLSGMGVFIEMRHEGETVLYIDYHVFVAKNEGVLLFGFGAEYEKILEIYNKQS